jgi:hypothetical protein
MLDSLLEKVRTHLGAPKKFNELPEGSEWSATADDDGVRIGVTISAELVGDDPGKDGPSAPIRALCLAAWLRRLGEPARVEIDVVDASFGQTLGQRRASFLLHEYAELLPELVTVRGARPWVWPSDPVFNVESLRSAKSRGQGRNGQLGLAFAGDRELRESMAALDGPVEPLRNKLPVGMYVSEVNRDTGWTPAGKTAVAMWTRTRDRHVVHLFELEAMPSGKVGTLAEAFYYARMLSHVRDRRAIEFAPSADGLSAVRNAKHLKMWLAGPAPHPLVWHPEHGSAPLDALNAALEKHRVTIGVMPVTLEPPTLHLDRRWPN